MLVRAGRQNLGQKRNEEQRVISPLWATRTQSGTVVEEGGYSEVFVPQLHHCLAQRERRLGFLSGLAEG